MAEEILNTGNENPEDASVQGTTSQDPMLDDP